MATVGPGRADYNGRRRMNGMIDYLRFTQTGRTWPEVATRRALEYSYFWVESQVHPPPPYDGGRYIYSVPSFHLPTTTVRVTHIMRR